jgi:RNA polymerase sigma-70 factor (ECF subfamily)
MEWLAPLSRTPSVAESEAETFARRQTVDLDDEFPSPRRDPHLLVEEAEDRRRLQKLIGALPRKDRDLIAIKFGAGLTNRQIAQITGKSETAVGSALYRLVRKLRCQWERT